jgi:hypothetical protein
MSNHRGETAMSSSDLEARITRLEDIEAIKYLKALYCDICDDRHNPDRITSCLSKMGFGKYRVMAKRKATTKSGRCFNSSTTCSASHSTTL